MATKYHITAKGEPAECTATVKGCPRGGSDEHYDSPEKARDAYEKKEGQDGVPTLKRSSRSNAASSKAKDKTISALRDLGPVNKRNHRAVVNTLTDDVANTTKTKQGFRDFKISKTGTYKGEGYATTSDGVSIQGSGSDSTTYSIEEPNKNFQIYSLPKYSGGHSRTSNQGLVGNHKMRENFDRNGKLENFEVQEARAITLNDGTEAFVKNTQYSITDNGDTAATITYGRRDPSAPKQTEWDNYESATVTYDERGGIQGFTGKYMDLPAEEQDYLAGSGAGFRPHLESGGDPQVQARVDQYSSEIAAISAATAKFDKLSKSTDEELEVERQAVLNR